MQKSFQKTTINGLPCYVCDKIPVKHFFTVKAGGVSTGACESLNLGFNRGDKRENVLENYRIAAAALGVAFDRITATRQVHGDKVAVAREQDAGMGLSKPFSWDADAVITDVPGLALAAFYADCVVTLLYDQAGGAIGVCHSGWRGAAKNLLGKTAKAMQQAYGTRPENLIACIGPSIRQCCFETDADVPDAVLSQYGRAAERFILKKGEKFHVDLQGLCRAGLLDAGVTEKHIVDSGVCTMCHADEFWSHRFTHGVRGVHAGMIVLPQSR